MAAGQSNCFGCRIDSSFLCCNRQQSIRASFALGLPWRNTMSGGKAHTECIIIGLRITTRKIPSTGGVLGATVM